MTHPLRPLDVRLRARVVAPVAALALLASVSVPTIVLGQAAPNIVAVTANGQIVRFNGTSSASPPTTGLSFSGAFAPDPNSYAETN